MTPCQPERSVLLSARDVGAAGHVAAIARALMKRGRPVQIVAQEPAYGTLVGSDLRVLGLREFLGDEGGLPGAAPVPSRVRAALDRLQPAALVLGQSNRAEEAIDDWLLAAAGPLPCVVMQDYWGEVQTGSRQPDLYLVLDALAKAVTEQRCAVPCAVVGSPKHGAYALLDVMGLRAAKRAKHRVSQGARVVGFFGQDLGFLSGYHAVVDDVATAVQGEDVVLFYRPHPREGAAGAADVMERFSRCGARPLLWREGTVEAALAAADVIISCFSTCGYDALHLAATAEDYNPVVVYADYYEDIKKYWAPHAGMDRLPAVAEGLAHEAANGSDLWRIVHGACGSSAALQRDRLKDVIPDPRDAADAAADAVLALVTSAETKGRGDETNILSGL